MTFILYKNNICFHLIKNLIKYINICNNFSNVKYLNKMKRKLVAYITRTLHSIIPANILLPILRNILKVPYLGRKIVSCFDPNSIRKHVSFDLSSKEIEFNFKNSKLHINIRDHIGYRTYITGEPFEMAVYHLAN